jgi:hypothetical protein
VNNEINTELLNNTSTKLINFLKKHSNLEFSITDSYNIYVSHKDNQSSNLVFKSNLTNIQPIIGIIYSFLMNHDVGISIIDCYGSIFKYAELCRNHYMNPRPIKANTISYEICYSEAGQVIKNLGFPTSLEELAIKMDLMGI